MATVKKSKKKIMIPICIVLVIAIVIGSIVGVKAKNKTVPVTLNTIATDNITEIVSATGDVSAGASREYKVGTVATVKEVFVKVGDEVKKGDLLATFDTSGLDKQASQLSSAYNDALKAYNDAVKNQKQAKAKLESVNEQIKKTEKQLKKAQENSKNPTTTTTKPAPSAPAATTTTTKPATTTTTTTTTAADSTTVSYEHTLDGAIEALTDLVNTIVSLSKDVQTTNAITREVLNAISVEIKNGNFSTDAIAKAAGDAMSAAIKQGLIDETKLIVESGVAVQMIETAVKSVDWKSVGAGVASDQSVQEASLNLQLAALYAQQQIYTAAADQTIVNTQKSIMQSAKSAYDAVSSAQQELSAGWTAEFDGMITECTVKPGEQTTVLESGIKLENVDKLIATISLGEYDIHKVKLGMEATITTAYGKYTGRVASIAPTATGGSESSIMDSVGSMAGISGLSSLTSSGAGVKCTVTIDDPDENIIIGFNADVEIATGEYTDVPCVPIESIILEKEGTYVYLYDEATSTVTKTKIETGAISDNAYEVTSGLKVGDKIIATPSSDYEEESFEVKVTNK